VILSKNRIVYKSEEYCPKKLKSAFFRHVPTAAGQEFAFLAQAVGFGVAKKQTEDS
jgi:hypothetical protein